MVLKECASAGSKNKDRVVIPHGSCSGNAHRYEVSSRQHSGDCGEDAESMGGL